MSPWRGGRCRFEVSLEDMASPRIIVRLAWPPGSYRLSERCWGVPGDSGLAEPDCPGAIEVLTDQDAQMGVASPVGAGRDIDDQASQADRVVVGHRGLIGEGDLDVALGRSDPAEDGTRLFRPLGKTAVEAVDEGPVQPVVGLVDLGDALEFHLGDEAVLERSSLTFDAALGLSGVGREGFDDEVLEDPTDVGGEADAGELLFMAPVLVTATEGGMAVLIDGRRHTVPSQDLIQDQEIADGILSRPELSAQDGPGGVVGGMDQRAGRSLRPEPAVGAAVPLHHQAHLGAARPAAAMAGRAAASFGRDPGLAQPTAHSLPADPESLAFFQHFNEVGVVEVLIAVFMKLQDALLQISAASVASGLATSSMSHARGPLFTVARQQTLGLTVANQ